MSNWFWDNIGWVITAVCSVLLICLVYFVWVDAHAIKISLTKADWNCTSSTTELLPQFINIGDSVIVSYIPITECVEYRRAK